MLGDFAGDFVARFDGPMHLRLYLQPLTAVLLAVRDGRSDARAGRSAYLWTVLTDANQRRFLIAEGWKGIWRVFLIACALDVAYQWIAWRQIKPVQVLLVATILAVLPYALLRGPANRLLSLWRGTT